MPQLAKFESIRLSSEFSNSFSSASEIEPTILICVGILYLLYLILSLRSYYLKSRALSIIFLYIFLSGWIYLMLLEKVSFVWFISAFLGVFSIILLLIRYNQRKYIQDRLKRLIECEQIILSDDKPYLKKILEEATSYVHSHFQPFKYHPFKHSSGKVTSGFTNNFSKELFKLIHERRMTELDFCHAAHIKRSILTRIQMYDLMGKSYYPPLKMVFAAAVGLHLDFPDTERFLQSAGYTISYARKFDVVMEYAIKRRLYDIPIINEILRSQGCSQLKIDPVALQLENR